MRESSEEVPGPTGSRLTEKDFLLSDEPSGPEAFTKTAQLQGTQADKAKFFERLVQELKMRTGWSARKLGQASDGSIVYRGKAQPKALVIRTDGRVFTGTMGKHVKLNVVDNQPTVEVDWTLEGWKQW